MWYVANLHKWAWAPRSAGFLWSSKRHQHELHPTAISWGLDNGITAEFDRPGTRDPSPFLTAPFAIHMMNELGGANGASSIYQYNHELAWWAGGYLADRWSTRFATPESMIVSMVNVRLPNALGATGDDALRVRSELESVGFEVPVFGGRQLTLRVCAQIYCDRVDIENLGEAVLKLAAARH